MRGLLSWLASASLSGAVLILGRWLLHISKPANDVAAIRRAWWKLEGRLREGWATVWRAYGPITSDMQAAWEQLRKQYRGGSFGLEGT